MCEPVTLAVLGGLAVAGSTYAQYQKGEAEAKAAQAQANAERAAAADSLQRGATAAGQVRTQASQQIGENTAALGASGVDVGAGSAGASAGDSRLAGELDVGTVKTNAAREAWGHQVNATNADFAAKNARYQGRLGALSTFLGGAASVGGQYYANSRAPTPAASTTTTVR